MPYYSIQEVDDSKPKEELRTSTLEITGAEGIRVIGNLPHGYCFMPKTPHDAEAIAHFLLGWAAARLKIEKS